MSSIDLDSIGNIHSNEEIKGLVCLVDSYVHKNSNAYYECKHHFKDFIEFETFFINELVRIVNERNLRDFDIQTFPWEEVESVIVTNFMIDFKTNQKNNIHLKIFLLEENREKIFEQLSIHCEYRYNVKWQYTTKITYFTRSEKPHNIKHFDTLKYYIERTPFNIFEDDFKIITPKIKQEVIDSFPRYYDYISHYHFVHHIDDMDSVDCDWENITFRLRLIDNGNQTITIKCYENDLYNFALEIINIGLNKYCYINPINDSLYSFHFNYENLLDVFNWIKNKKLPLKIDFIYNNKQCTINRKIKSINSPKILSQHIEENCEIERKYINGILFDDDSILVEFE